MGARGKHRTEAMEVTEGGIESWGETVSGDATRCGEKWAQGEKHRTEATEVTEGKLRLGVKLLAATRRPAGEKWAQGEKHRTEVTEVTEGGTEVVGETASGDATRCRRKRISASTQNVIDSNKWNDDLPGSLLARRSRCPR